MIGCDESGWMVRDWKLQIPRQTGKSDRDLSLQNNRRIEKPNMSFRIQPIKPHIGALVHVDRAELCDDEIVQQCLDALERHSVLVFPRIGLTDEVQLAFTDKLGARVNFTRTVAGANASTKDVYTVTLDPKVNPEPEYVYGTFFWHMDGVTVDIPPPKASVLSARRVAPKGGQTEFASTYAAYESLPDSEKEDIAGLRAMHSVLSSMRSLIDVPCAEELERWTNRGRVKEHPLVWTHPTGRKSLIIGSHADRIVDTDLPEGRALLTRLVEWAAQPAFTYRHQWEEGDLVVWDNTGTLHRVIPYDKNSGRKMHRTSVAGVYEPT
jgi:alpha-ketoglutarate-dependent taurine dioxygenase